MTNHKVLHITTSFPLHEDHSSGWFVLNQVRPLPELGWNVTVLAPHAPGAISEESFGAVRVVRKRYADEQKQGIAYGGGIPANLNARPALWLQVPGFFSAMKKAALELASSVDLIHAHWSFSGLIAASVAKKTGKPFIVNFHGSDLMGAGISMRQVARLVAGKAAKVIVHSDVMEEMAQALCKTEKIRVLSHGVDVEAIAPASPGGADRPIRIIAVGRLTEEKDFATLIDALETLADRTDWTCTIVGDGPLKAELVQRADDAEIAGRVNFAGEMGHSDLLNALSQSHIGVVSSLREGFSMACLEQSAAGLPVVATRSGGPEWIVEHDKTGLLVPVHTPTILADGIAKLLDDPELRRELGQSGRQHALDEFSSAAMSKKLAALYEEVLR